MQLPFWVKRWAAARLLSESPDMRRFDEQADYTSVLDPVMPDGEHDDVARLITEETIPQLFAGDEEA